MQHRTSYSSGALRRSAVTVAALVLAVLAVGVTPASAGVAAYSEPAYTKTAANNSYWFSWQAVTGLNENNTTNYTYYHCLTTLQNNIEVESSDGTNGPGSTNCTGSLRSGPTPSSGNSGYTPFSSGTVLANGARYEMCANGWRRYVYIWSHDNTACAATIIDRTKPSIGVAMAGGAQYTKAAEVPLRISYTDAISPPWFGATQGQASNWTCINRGAVCTPSGQPDQNCSWRNYGNSKTDFFDCAVNLAAQPDGTYYFCAFSADAAVPDNPSGTNQFFHAQSNKANLSDRQCDSVVVDRAGPSVTANASSTTVTTGELVSFTASATDPSGVTGSFTWDFGDNTAPGAGAVTTHTYTQPGTYVARATTSDAAGNQGQGTRTITVTAPPTNNPDPGGGGGGGTTDPGGSTTDPGTGGTGDGTTNPGGGGTGSTGDSTSNPGPGTSQGTSGATPTQTPTPTTVISQQSGGGGAQETAVGRLGITAPKKLVVGKRSLLLAFTPQTPGKVAVALLKGPKIVAKKGATFGSAGTYSFKLKLPKRLKKGAYKLKISFTAAGASKATTKTLRVKVAKKKRAKGATASVARAARSLQGAPASRTPLAARPPAEPRLTTTLR